MGTGDNWGPFGELAVIIWQPSIDADYDLWLAHIGV
jgi:hypothetical protein